MIQLSIVIGYLALLVALGVFSNRRLRSTSEDYMLASHSIGPLLLLMSLFGTTMTAFALVGSTGEAFTRGAGVYAMLASSSGIVHSLCFFLVGVPLWRLGRRHGYVTQVQFFRDRLESDWIGLALFAMLVGLVVPYLLIGVISAGQTIEEVTRGAFESQGWFAGAGYGVPRWLAALVVCLVVLTYVFFGGMRGTAWANALQTLIFMSLGVATFFTIARGLGGQEGLLENMQAATAAADPSNLTREKIPPAVYFSFLLIPLSVAAFPHVFQHWLTARSAASFKLPIVMHPIFILIVWLPCVLMGVWASGVAWETPVHPNEVLAAMVRRFSGDMLAGLLTAGILAAIMSSLDSQFLCLGTIFTEDIVVRYGGRNRFSEKQIVLMARCFIVAIVGVTYLLSLAEPRRVFALGTWCFSGFTGLFPLIVASLYWRRLTLPGAAASVFSVAAAWGWMFYQSGWGARKDYMAPAQPIELGGVTVLPPMAPIVVIVLLATLSLIAVSLITRPPSEKTLAKFFDR